MKKKIIAIILGTMALFSMLIISSITTKSDVEAASTADPIFFVPGAYSNVDSWDKMYQRLDPQGVHPVVKLEVSTNGTVQRTNVRMGKTGERPFVTINNEDYLWDDQAVYEGANGIDRAIQSYKTQNPFDKADIIGQSNGGNQITRYMELYPSKMFGTFLSTGTPYNMRADNGAAPTDLLLNLIAGAPRLDPNLKVINCIGRTPTDLTTDEVVSRDSAMSGRNIFVGNVASFTNLYFTGDDAIHSHQIESAQLQQFITKYINIGN
ncbi:alpha/beta hydrolase [Companilactobacillus versmoldensis]|uniref:Alpha beta hydrolase superfamily protein n=1 Tax=Companilactobacillus versmoldensis DSM 14857 = KCTC 3814 TaxID=1423815 RepID=A0A0R1SEC2_9LACO|nr:alpha/beta hydrolase [Companilactobacillus versmoldensis]KRL66926.1 alpha beta hydrolase superfamily protein [Companilactobacillus versmoldensis DSM 14857 = KCTC 3814]